MSMIRDQLIGDVFLRDYDLGMAVTLGCVEVGQQYYLMESKVPGVTPPLFTEYYGDPALRGTPMPGIPLIYATPSSPVERYTLPCIRIRREDPSAALERWMSKHYKYRRPADGESEISVQYRTRTVTGYAKYEEQEGSYPYDIPYTLTVESAGKGARRKAHTLLQYCMKRFPPHAKLRVVDSEGRERKYWVFVEGPSDLSVAADIRDRTIIFALSLRVQGELDLKDPVLRQAMTSEPTMSMGDMGNKPEEG